MGRAMQCLYLIALLVFGVFILTGQAEESCEVRALPSEVYVSLGEWVLLNCTFNCPRRTIWETRLLKRDAQGGPNWASVEVFVDDWEKSELYCIQSLGDGNIAKSMSVVMAYAFAGNVTIDLDPELEEGRAHSVTCIVYDVAPVENLQIQLLRAYVVIRNSTFKEGRPRGKQIMNVTYEVTASRTDNLQNFSCLATLKLAAGNLLTVSSSSVTVRTYGPPDIPIVTITPGPNIQEGDSFTITCLSDGLPSPEYHWIVPTGANVTYSRNNSTLSVARARQIHNGTYICQARNKHGRVGDLQNVQVIPLTKGLPRSRIGDIISAVLVSIIIPCILWKTRIRSSVPRDSD